MDNDVFVGVRAEDWDEDDKPPRKVRIFRYLSPGGYTLRDSMVPNSQFLVEVAEDESDKDRDELEREKE